MPVTDHQIATLRAMLAADFDEYDRLRGQLDRDADRDGYSALIAAGFFRAANRRFSKDATDAEVIEFVGDVRARSGRVGDRLDPHVAEANIRAALGREADTDFDSDTIVSTQLLLLAAFIADAHLDDTELGTFLADVRELADKWMT